MKNSNIDHRTQSYIRYKVLKLTIESLTMDNQKGLTNVEENFRENKVVEVVNSKSTSMAQPTWKNREFLTNIYTKIILL